MFFFTVLLNILFVFLKNTFSGVFSDTTCKTAWADLDHGVTVVGYNTDSTGVAYWIGKY